MSNTRQEPNVRPAVDNWPVTVEVEIRTRVASVAKRGELADIREPLYQALPFLDATVREALARELVATHAEAQS